MAKWNLNKLSKDDYHQARIDPRHIIDRLDDILKNLERAEFDVEKSLNDLRLHYIKHSASTQHLNYLNEQIRIRNEQ